MTDDATRPDPPAENESQAPEETGASCGSGRWPCPARWLVWTLLLVELVYLVAGNLFLRTAWGPELLDRRPERLQITWQDAWTPVPGLVRVRGFDIRGRTPRTTWHVAADEAWGWIALLELPRRSFRVRWLRAEGIRTAVAFARYAPDGERPDASRAALQPRISGFDGPQPAPLSDRPGWRLRFDAVTIDGIGETWLGPTRYQPTEPGGRALGRVDATVRGPVALPRVSIDMPPGSATAGDELVGKVKRLSFLGELEPLVFQEVKGLDRLHHVTGRLELATEAGRLGLVDYFFRGSPVSVSGDGRLDASVEMERGVLRPQTELKVDDGRLDLAWLGWQGEGQGTAQGSVDDSGHARMEVTFDRFAVRRDAWGTAAPPIQGTGLHLEATTGELDLASPSPHLDATADLPASEVPDLSLFDTYLPAGGPAHLDSGRARISGRLHLVTETGAVDGAVRIEATDIEVRVGRQQVRADLELDATVPSGRIPLKNAEGASDTAEFKVDGSRLQLRNVSGAGVEDWWGDLTVEQGTVRATASAEGAAGDPGTARSWRTEAEVTARLADATPLVALIADRNPRLAFIDRLPAIRDLDLDGAIHADPQGAGLHDLRLSGSHKLEILGQARFRDHGHLSLLHLALGPLSGAVRADQQGVLDWKLVNSLEWYQVRSARFWDDE